MPRQSWQFCRNVIHCHVFESGVHGSPKPTMTISHGEVALMLFVSLFQKFDESDVYIKYYGIARPDSIAELQCAP